jgi:hypothetical protein
MEGALRASLSGKIKLKGFDPGFRIQAAQEIQERHSRTQASICLTGSNEGNDGRRMQNHVILAPLNIIL